MTSSLNYLRKSIQHEIKKYTKQLAAVDTLPDLGKHFPQGTWTPQWGRLPEFQLPYDFELIAQVLEHLRKEGFELKDERDYIWAESQNAGKFLRAEKGNCTFEVAFRTRIEGTTCILHKIGSEVREVPVFEIICKEGVQEGTLDVPQE